MQNGSLLSYTDFKDWLWGSFTKTATFQPMIELEQYFWSPIDVFHAVYPYLFSLMDISDGWNWLTISLGEMVHFWVDETEWWDETRQQDETRQWDKTGPDGTMRRSSKTCMLQLGPLESTWNSLKQRTVCHGEMPRRQKLFTEHFHTTLNEVPPWRAVLFLMWRTPLRYSYRKEKDV